MFLDFSKSVKTYHLKSYTTLLYIIPSIPLFTMLTAFIIVYGIVKYYHHCIKCIIYGEERVIYHTLSVIISKQLQSCIIKNLAIPCLCKQLQHKIIPGFFIIQLYSIRIDDMVLVKLRTFFIVIFHKHDTPLSFQILN